MKHNFDGPIDLHKHELLNARLQALITLPPDPFEGQVCYASSSDKKLGAIWNGVEWLYFGFTWEKYLELINLPDPEPQGDRVTVEGTLQFDSPTILSGTGWSVVVGGNEYNNFNILLDPVEGTPVEFTRRDIVTINAAGLVRYTAGIEYSEGVIQPQTPAGELLIAFIDRTPEGDDTIYVTPEELTDFVSKSDQNLQTIQSDISLAALSGTKPNIMVLGPNGEIQRGSVDQAGVYSTLQGIGGYSRILTILITSGVFNYDAIIEFSGVSVLSEKGFLWVAFSVDSNGAMVDNKLQTFGKFTLSKYKLVRVSPLVYELFAQHDDFNAFFKFRPQFNFGGSSRYIYYHLQPKFDPLPSGEQYSFTQYGSEVEIGFGLSLDVDGKIQLADNVITGIRRVQLPPGEMFTIGEADVDVPNGVATFDGILVSNFYKSFGYFDLLNNVLRGILAGDVPTFGILDTPNGTTAIVKAEDSSIRTYVGSTASITGDNPAESLFLAEVTKDLINADGSRSVLVRVGKHNGLGGQEIQFENSYDSDPEAHNNRIVVIDLLNSVGLEDKEDYSAQKTELAYINKAWLRSLSGYNGSSDQVLQHNASGVFVWGTGGGGGGGLWTEGVGFIYRDSPVSIGSAILPSNATFAVKSKSTVSTLDFIQISDNSDNPILKITNGANVQIINRFFKVGNPTTNLTDVCFKTIRTGSGQPWFRAINGSNVILFEITGASVNVPVSSTFGNISSGTSTTFSSSFTLNGQAIYVVRSGPGNDIRFTIFGDGSFQSNGSKYVLGNVLTPTNNGFSLKGGLSTNNSIFQIDNSSDSRLFEIRGDGKVFISSIPTSDPLEAGVLWNDGGTIKISAG